jgi:hypothetical protein
MHRKLRVLASALALGASALGHLPCAQAQQVSPLGGADWAWPQWQARLAVSEQPIGWSASLLEGRLPAKMATLAGDRYFDIGRLGDAGGLRATGALTLGTGRWSPGSLNRTADSTDLVASPYLGMGYSAWWARSSLGLSADLGLLGQHHAASGLAERWPAGLGSLSDATRSLQWAPVMKVHLAYTF